MHSVFFLGGAICLLGLILMTLYEVHCSTYLWQSTYLAEFMHANPVRSSCFDNGSIAPLRQHLLGAKIAILAVFEKKSSTSAAGSSWSSAMMERVLKNRIHYASIHGYDVLVAQSPDVFDKSVPVAWSKLKAGIVALQQNKYDYVFYIDMDAVIINYNIQVADLLAVAAVARNITASQLKDPSTWPMQLDFVMTNDWNGPNTGAWLARRGDFSSWLLEEAFSYRHELSRKKERGSSIAYPFEYEQRAFHYLLDTKMWRRRGLKRYDAESGSSESGAQSHHHRFSTQQIRQHITFVPQCAFNSYSLHPMDWRGDREHVQVSDYCLCCATCDVSVVL